MSHLIKKTLISLIVILLLYSFKCFYPSEPNNRQLINYAHLINEAERCILEEDYIKANNSYKQAFKTESEPYAKHCFTAAQVSAVCNEFEDFIFYSRKGFKSGLIYSDFENDSILIDFIKTNK